ncbi:hypothetical protein [Paracoccus aminovorans]|uniref:hypothetical protein n=1 Tax=Paracoccus aminovorans TaxID=34004 RepID=UPI000C26D235|nr:hypothetical protein [Paracoccus aminovorans]
MLETVCDDTRGREACGPVSLGIAWTFIEVRIARGAAKLRAEDVVLEAAAIADDGRILERPMGMSL